MNLQHVALLCLLLPTFSLGKTSTQSNGISLLQDEPGCVTVCPTFYLPMCGSDDETYTNVCLLEVEKCVSGKADLMPQCSGECPCGDGTCTHPFTGETTQPISCFVSPCLGAVCPNDAGAVCYENYCGDCNAVWMNGNQRPQCECDDACASVSDPVCGSDDKTYQNECELNISLCKARKDDQKASLTVSCYEECPCTIVDVPPVDVPVGNPPVDNPGGGSVCPSPPPHGPCSGFDDALQCEFNMVDLCKGMQNAYKGPTLITECRNNVWVSLIIDPVAGFAGCGHPVLDNTPIGGPGDGSVGGPGDGSIGGPGVQEPDANISGASSVEEDFPPTTIAFSAPNPRDC